MGPTRDRRRARLAAAAVNVDDFRALAAARLPRAVFDFVDGGADAEVTCAANGKGWSELRFRPTALADVANRQTTTTVLDNELALPVILGPAGLARSVSPADGEPMVARAAARAGSVYITSTGASAAVEDVVAAGGANAVWFQLYMWQDREATRALVRRAARAGCSTLVLTVDTAVVGQRERDVRRGLVYPPKIRPRDALEVLRVPSWVFDFVRSGPIEFANFGGSEQGRAAPTPLADVTWRDVEQLRDDWSGRLLVKGVMTPEDATAAVDRGVDGVIVSNHGGRQLDCLPPTSDALPGVVDAVAGRAAVLVDGGIRRGSDVVKALALGADACLVARPYLFALGAAGEPGIDRMFAIFQREIDRCLALLGRPDIRCLDRGCLW